MARQVAVAEQGYYYRLPPVAQVVTVAIATTVEIEMAFFAVEG
jgi:hypothetical protein